MMSAKIFVFSFMFLTAAPGVSCNTCTEAEPSTEDAEATSGGCLMQNQLLKGTVKAEEMEEDGTTDSDASDAESDVKDEADDDAVSEQQATEDEFSELEEAQEPAEPVIPKCAAKADCKADGQDCVGGICINAATLKYKWTLATVDKKCSGKSIGALDKGKPEILTCKKKCEKIPGCTGFNRGKKGAIESRCWFFSACTKDTPKGKLASSTMHNVYFVSATAEVEVSKQVMQTITEKKQMKVLGLTQGEDEQEAAQHAEKEQDTAQHKIQLETAT